MNPKLKQTRARSEEKKEEQFERILDAGKELFLKKGSEGFSMRNLAEMLDMTKNNLYNYIESKRELWIAIRNKFYNQFKETNLELIKSSGYVKKKCEKCEKRFFWTQFKDRTVCGKPKCSGGSIFNEKKIELILQLYEHFLDYANKDYDQFKMMFNVIEAPPSNKIGPIEAKYREYRLLDGTTKLIQEAIDEGEIKEDAAPLLSLLMYSIVMGVAYIQMNRTKEHGPPNRVWETIQLSQVDISFDLFKKQTMRVLKYILANNEL